jgi:hypothetical protein
MELTLTEIREQGIGNGFTVLNPADGYRKDNALWFGNCATCGKRVTQSRFHKYWEHTIQVAPNTYRGVDYCPAVQ